MNLDKLLLFYIFFFSSRRRHTRFDCDWSSDVCSSDLYTHIPTSRRTAYPMGGELPDEYSRTQDPFIALMAAAACTEQLRVGTGVCLVVERDPIVLAKEVSTLDVLSGGRVLLGVGAGWNAEELAHHCVDFG